MRRALLVLATASFVGYFAFLNLAPANNQLVTVTATMVVSDNADPSPTITLVSITTNDGKHAKREDVQTATVVVPGRR